MDGNLLACDGMHEAFFSCMEHKSVWDVLATVRGISQDGEPGMAQMNADLVLAAGEQVDAEQGTRGACGVGGGEGQEMRPGERWLAGATHAHAATVVTVASDRISKRSRALWETSAYDGEVPLLNTSLGDKAVKERLRLFLFGKQNDARGLAVKPLQGLQVIQSGTVPN